MNQSFIALPPDSTGKKLHTREILVNPQDTEGVQNQVYSLGDPYNLEQLQRVDEYGAAYVRGAEGSTLFDSFGKTKVSEEKILGAYVNEYDEMPDKYSVLQSGISQLVYSPSEKAVRLQVDTGGTDAISRTTHKYHKYTPGTSQYILMTVVNGDTGKTGVTRRWGYYDDNNGVFFELADTTLNLVIRSDVSGSVVETRVPQSQFNGDTIDGNGVSKMLLDPSKSNIYWIDLQWLGVGRVRFGVISPEGNRVMIHTFENANSTSTIYMGTGSLPLRNEIFNTEVTSSVSELKVLNSIVFTESSNVQYDGSCSSIMNGATTPVPITDAWTHIMTLKPNLQYKGKPNRTAFVPLAMTGVTSEITQISIMKNANLSGTETYSDVVANGPMSYSIDGSYVDGGTKVFCGIVPAGVTKIDLSDDFDYLHEYLSTHADASDADTYTIVARTIGGVPSGTIIFGCRWDEIVM